MTDTTETSAGAFPVDEGFVRFCIAAKESKVAEADFDVKQSDDIAPILMFKDDEGPIAIVRVHEINRDHALDAMYRLTQVFSATELLAVFDSHFTDQPINPKTGEAWGDLEMQRACDEDGACSLGIITDTLSIQGYARSGEHWMVNRPYHIGYANHEVHWQERQDRFDSGDGGYHIVGLIPDVAREALQQPRFSDVATAHLQEVLGSEGADITIDGVASQLGLDDRQTKLHMWLAGMQVAGFDDRWTIVLTLRDEEEAKVAQESAERWERRRKAADLFARAAGENVARRDRDPFAAALDKVKQRKSGLILP